MFGYITVNKMDLKGRDFYRYRAYYCGLCRKLGEKYGLSGRMTLTYEFTFLTVLLTALYDRKSSVEKGRCFMHPCEKRYRMTNEFTDYCADMNIILAYYSLMDNWQDDRDVKSLIMAKGLDKKVKRLERRYKRQASVIKRELRLLTSCEENGCEDIDEVSGHFGRIVEELFVYKKDIWEDNLRKMGFYLGKFIYLMDAWDDYEDDSAKNEYNIFKMLKIDNKYDEHCHTILVMMMAEVSRNFEMLPIVKNSELLRNILYSGVWQKWYISEKKHDNVKEEGEENGSL